MAITYLNSQMIEIPAAIIQLSATNLSAENLQVSNLIATSVSVPSFGNANEWNQAYTLVKNNSASWEESTGITGITTTVADNSGKWENVYNGVTFLSSSWQSSYNHTNALSSNWQSTYETVDALSSTWKSVYLTVSALSAVWEETAVILPTVTNYLSTELVTVSSLSATDTITTTNLIVLSTEQVPTLSTDPGIKGTFKWDSNYLYICVETDSWKRVALSGWEG